MSIFDIDINSHNRLHPFYRIRVYLTGHLHDEKKTLELLKEFKITVMTELTYSTNVIVVGENEPHDDVVRKAELYWDGYDIATISEEELHKLLSWDYETFDTWLVRMRSIKEGKNLNITYDRLFNSAYSPIMHISLEDVEKPLAGKAFFVPYDGEESVRLSQSLERLGAKVTGVIRTTEPAYCILKESTLEKLKDGEKDRYIQTIEKSYNSSRCERFPLQFLVEDDGVNALMRWAMRTGNDEFQKMLSQYMNIEKVK